MVNQKTLQVLALTSLLIASNFSIAQPLMGLESEADANTTSQTKEPTELFGRNQSGSIDLFLDQSSPNPIRIVVSQDGGVADQYGHRDPGVTIDIYEISASAPEKPPSRIRSAYLTLRDYSIAQGPSTRSFLSSDKSTIIITYRNNRLSNSVVFLKLNDLMTNPNFDTSDFLANGAIIPNEAMPKMTIKPKGRTIYTDEFIMDVIRGDSGRLIYVSGMTVFDEQVVPRDTGRVGSLGGGYEGAFVPFMLSPLLAFLPRSDSHSETKIIKIPHVERRAIYEIDVWGQFRRVSEYSDGNLEAAVAGTLAAPKGWADKCAEWLIEVAKPVIR